jgi:hypothetical protein
MEEPQKEKKIVLKVVSQKINSCLIAMMVAW